MMRFNNAGWIRVGRYDSAKRRALWIRFLGPKSGGPITDPVRDTITAIEMCSGREGDDGHCIILEENPSFDSLLDVLLHAADHIPEDK